MQQPDWLAEKMVASDKKPDWLKKLLTINNPPVSDEVQLEEAVGEMLESFEAEREKKLPPGKFY